MKRFVRNITSIIGVGLLVLAVMVGLFALNPIMAQEDDEVEPQTPTIIVLGSSPPSVLNDGTGVMNFNWDISDWAVEYHAWYYSFSILKPDTTVLYSQDSLAGDIFPGIIGPLVSVDGMTGGPAVHILQPESPSAHTWTVPAGTPAGGYTARIEFWTHEWYDEYATYEASMDVSFGVLQAVGELVVFKYNDLNGNGDWDGGEPGVQDFTFDITGPENYLDQVTDANGLITLSDIPIGDYTVTEESPLPAGWVKTEPADAADYTQQATVTSGGSVQVDFGNQQVGNLEIIKEDEFETRLVGWHFEVTGPENMSGDTGAGGILLFEDIPVGNYTVEETMEPGWTNVEPPTGPPYTMPAAVPFNDTVTVTFVNEETIGDLEIIKKDDTGTGLAGWHFDVTGPVNLSGNTNGSGVLLFQGIPVGDYTVTETMKPGWTNIEPPTGPPYEKDAEVLLDTKTTVEFINQRPPSVPTLGQWGMIIMGILFAALVIWLPIRRRRLAANR